MRRKILCMLIVYFACTFNISSVVAQDRSSIDKLQAGVRTETVNSLHRFIRSIVDLDPEVQKKLITARLINSKIVFKHYEKIRLANYSEEHYKKNGYSDGRIIEKNDYWILTHGVFTSRDWPRVDKSISSGVTLKIAPNAEIDEFMKVFVEFLEYSKEDIDISNLKIDITGSINSFSWVKRTTPYYGAGPYYGPFAYELVLDIGTYSVDRLYMSSGGAGWNVSTCGGTVRAHIIYLKKMISQWVKFYMGKRSRPKPINCD